MRRSLASLAALTAFIHAPPAPAQEAAHFGAWRAFCAPMAGCVLGVNSGEGDTLAFMEPPSGDDRLLVVLQTPIRPGASMVVSMDGGVVVTLGPGDGWRQVEGVAGPMVQIAPSIARDALMQPMRRLNSLEVSYTTIGGRERRIVFSLNGYADTRAYASDE